MGHRPEWVIRERVIGSDSRPITTASTAVQRYSVGSEIDRCSAVCVAETLWFLWSR